MENIEKKILDELQEEMKELARRGKIHQFEKAMDNAMEKFKTAMLENAEDTLNKDVNGIIDEDSKKKMLEMWKRSHNSK